MALNVVGVLVFLVILSLGSCNSNINSDSCPITGGCLPCISTRSPDVERCMQLYFLVSWTTNHSAEATQFCAESCPIILATTFYFCGNTDSIQEIFDACPNYNVQPSGQGTYDFTTDRDDSCYSEISDNSRCELCLHKQSGDALTCLQRQLLVQYSVNTGIGGSLTSYVNSFCSGQCPLTLATTNGYCNTNQSPFELCRRNTNGMFCSEADRLMATDSDVDDCIGGNCTSITCMAVINRYGCCVTRRDSFFQNACGIEPCSILETGGSPTHLATLCLIVMMVLSAVFMI